MTTALTDDGYPMHRWFFEDAAGRYDLDLGDSYLDCGSVDDLPYPAGLSLDYGSNRGSVPLRELVAGRYGRDAADVGVTHGAQEALYLLHRVLLRPGDHVVAFTPGWPQAWEVPTELGCRVDRVGTTPDGDPDIARAVRLIGPRTRAVVLNSPCNPTGRRVPERDVASLVTALRAHGSHLILDEEYVADLARDSLLGRYERAVSVSGVSKVYGFPGLRTGWMCGPADLVAAAMERKHSTTLANSVLTDALAAEVLRRHDHYLDRYLRLTSGGIEVLRDWVARHPDVFRLLKPQGTPFAWLVMTVAGTSLAFCREVLRARVLLMPAEVFGTERGLRITFAREESVLREGLRRIDAVLAAHGHSAGRADR
ncbi:pyridoxal phosphate-dependent aminotransferase [Streptomyces sp. RB6PN25]|uniref:Pyridoxal phosphate-dependent aminotransferase n=1 Tax=Streptomyces humicola TaxID=2953240 RepID=A0ABT1PTX5_9ACTN|nr:pyridoxal phosphate-dependent aminotransferase [Streptomyces humicola]MCQ4081117.1 pyridoxal phosphate-dependent aminotransferase [Streptomyces humicola]